MTNKTKQNSHGMQITNV